MSRTVARLDAEVRKSARRAAAEPRLGPDAEKEPDSELNL
jgi:hypothetical protein